MLNRRTWLGAVAALPFLKPKTKLRNWTDDCKAYIKVGPESATSCSSAILDKSDWVELDPEVEAKWLKFVQNEHDRVMQTVVQKMRLRHVK